MSFLFGGGPNRERDPELAAATARRERRFNLDIGNQGALGRDAPPRQRRIRPWLVGFIVIVVVVTIYRATTATSRGAPITRSCTTPAVVVGSTVTGPGDRIEWSGTGPLDDYTLAVDGVAATGAGGAPVVHSSADGGFVLHFRMDGCLVHSQLTAPKQSGAHVVRLFRLQPGGYVVVATKRLTVS
ncbi:MAG: hypothetical protein ACR2JQ_01615 [Mycobacteriales bacterium]